MKKGTDSYLDDILVYDTVVSALDAVEHLTRFGLVSKEPEPMEGGVVLGLRIETDGTGNLLFRRSNEIPNVTDESSSPCVGPGVVWCDASSIATGVVLEIGGVVVEDGAWQRKKDDYHHINVLGLDAVIKGVNLALKWGLREIEIRTDSATIAGWMNSVLTAEKKVRTKGAADVLVKRRRGIPRELIDELGVKMRVTQMPSRMNKIDALTRVKKIWLEVPEEQAEKFEVCVAGPLCVKALHGIYHLGVDRSLFLVRKVDPNITKEEVRRAVRACVRCQ
ncbi:uncharacterized protein LOC143021987 [Oratosquilla oratoria]|uniref:uncharacterized protein LOC143021987 n=1 Tax=Oratosquilla oratoria TaxID=337810 RepID=UPI003F76372F